MKFGLMHDFRNPAPWFRPYGELYRLLTEQCVRAEELGYDNIWLTEHHIQWGLQPRALTCRDRDRDPHGTDPPRDVCSPAPVLSPGPRG